MAVIILKSKNVPKENKIPSSETTRGPTLDVRYSTMRDRYTRNLFTKSEYFGLSGSGDGDTSKKNPFINKITHGTHHPMSVCDIFNCNRHIEVGNMNKSNFIRDFMKGKMD